MAQTLPHFLLVWLLSKIIMESKNGHGETEFLSRQAELASTIGQVRPCCECLQVLSKLGQELFLIGCDFATTPSHLQRLYQG